MHRVLHAFVDPNAFRQSLPDIWSGFQINVEMMLIAEALVLVLALLIAVVRGLPGRGAKPFRGLAILYTDFFRGTPLTIVAFLFILGIPGLQINGLSSYSNTVYGIAALTVVYTAYVTEVYRAGIESVHGSQRMAARSLGLTYWQAMRHVVIPQAVRRVVPPLLNGFVELAAVTKRFGDNVVLRAVDLAVDEHQVVCLIGASGSGKSTLLRCVNLLERIDEGTIVVDGQTITDGNVDVNELRRKIGIVFQAYNLFPHMTVLDNVTLAPRKVRGFSKADAEAPGRDHERARPAARGRGARARPQPHRGRDDDDHRHARDELRARGGRQGLLPRRGRDPRGGAAGADLLGASRGAHARVP